MTTPEASQDPADRSRSAPLPPAHHWTALLVSALLAFAAAAFGGIFTGRAVSTWYTTIAKPEWTPPGWIFGPVWTVLYAAMAIAAWLVWRRRQNPSRRAALSWYGLQLVLNALWSMLFFGLRSPLAGLLDIVALWATIVVTIVFFARISRPAAALMIPYLLWVSFAAALNLAIWRLNP